GRSPACGRPDCSPRRRVGRLRRLAFQPPPVEYRTTAETELGVLGLARGYGAPAGSALGRHPAMNSVTSEQALIRAADDGVHQISVPTPFAVGRVNAYLIEAERLTLVDVGPNSDRALVELERHLGDI